MAKRKQKWLKEILDDAAFRVTATTIFHRLTDAQLKQFVAEFGRGADAEHSE